MRALIHKLIGDIFFPQKCLGCGKFGKYLCQTCLPELRDNDIFYPKNADFAFASFSYRAPAVKKVVRKLKYYSASDAARELAGVMAEDISKNPVVGFCAETPVVCEIPMTIKRKRKRGFNQAELLAKHLAEFLDFEYRPLLLKTREIRPQAEIRNKKERFENIKGAFEISRGFEPPSAVIIIDDVITTGATMSEAARVLRRNGVKKIICISVAR